MPTTFRPSLTIHFPSISSWKQSPHLTSCSSIPPNVRSFVSYVRSQTHLTLLVQELQQPFQLTVCLSHPELKERLNINFPALTLNQMKKSGHLQDKLKTKLQETISLFLLEKCNKREDTRLIADIVRIVSWSKLWDLAKCVNGLHALLESSHIHRTLTEPALYVILIVWTHHYLLTF